MYPDYSLAISPAVQPRSIRSEVIVGGRLPVAGIVEPFDGIGNSPMTGEVEKRPEYFLTRVCPGSRILIHLAVSELILDLRIGWACVPRVS